LLDTIITKERIPVKPLLLYGFWPSPIKKFIYKMKGYKIGKNVKIGIGSVIIGRRVTIEDNVSIGFLTIIRAREMNLSEGVSIGSFCFIDTIVLKVGEDTRIRESVYVGGITTPESKLIIGERCTVMQNSFLNPSNPITIGDDSGVGGHSLLFTHASWLSKLDAYPVTFAPIEIGKNVWLPWRVFIMPGVRIGDNVVIGANSVITTNIPSNTLASGNPAKVLVENYPRAISADRKKKYFDGIIDEFIRHMEFDKHICEKKISNENVSILLNDGTKKYEVRVIYNANEISSTEAEDNILVMYCEGTLPANSKFNMSVSVPHKVKTGSTEIGEIFVRFLSRYGIRFKRKK
jgi:acetyltransferase-like isoleucine patch superfamily enzyme